jgi:carbamate kinase
VGADLFMILTEVDQVYLNFGKKEQKGLRTLRLQDAKQYLKEGQFPAGSMGPKIEACIRFIEYGGAGAIITCLDCADEALDGKGGTLISS